MLTTNSDIRDLLCAASDSSRLLAIAANGDGDEPQSEPLDRRCIVCRDAADSNTCPTCHQHVCAQHAAREGESWCASCKADYQHYFDALCALERMPAPLPPSVA